MADNIGLNKSTTLPIFRFFFSYLSKYKLKLAKGKKGSSNGVILFSHGRTASPFMYSTILKNLARTWTVISPQHK